MLLPGFTGEVSALGNKQTSFFPWNPLGNEKLIKIFLSVLKSKTKKSDGYREQKFYSIKTCGNNLLILPKQEKKENEEKSKNI